MVANLGAASDRYLSEGLTSCQEAGVGGILGTGEPRELAAYQQARRDGRLRLRVTLMVSVDTLHDIDHHVDDPEPFAPDLGLHSGFGRRPPPYRRDQDLRRRLIDGPHRSDVGKLAVLDRDLTAIEPDGTADTDVLATMVGGRFEFDAPGLGPAPPLTRRVSSSERSSPSDRGAPSDRTSGRRPGCGGTPPEARVLGTMHR
jgi:hypothetical protein